MAGKKRRSRSKKSSILRDRFDFELGYLSRSPCLTCSRRNEAPECRRTCTLLDHLQTLLARGISTQRKGQDL